MSARSVDAVSATIALSNRPNPRGDRSRLGIICGLERLPPPFNERLYVLSLPPDPALAKLNAIEAAKLIHALIWNPEDLPNLAGREQTATVLVAFGIAGGFRGRLRGGGGLYRPLCRAFVRRSRSSAS